MKPFLTIELVIRPLSQRAIVQGSLAFGALETFLVIDPILPCHLLCLKHLEINRELD